MQPSFKYDFNIEQNTMRPHHMLTMLIILFAINLLGMMFVAYKNNTKTTRHFESFVQPTSANPNVFSSEVLTTLAQQIVQVDSLDYSILDTIVFDTPNEQSKGTMKKQIASVVSAAGDAIWKTMMTQQWIVLTDNEGFGGRKFFIYPSNGSFNDKSKLLGLLNLYNGRPISFYIPTNCQVILHYEGRVFEPEEIDVKNSAQRSNILNSLSQKMAVLSGQSDAYMNDDIVNVTKIEVKILQS